MSEMLDFNDQKVVHKFQDETIKLADTYKTAVTSSAQGEANIKLAMIKAYRAGELGESKSAIEKVMLEFIAKHPELEQDYRNMIEEEAVAKGLEKLIDSRDKKVTLEQSFIKSRRGADV